MRTIWLSDVERYIRNHKATPSFHTRQALLVGDSPLHAHILQTLVRWVTQDKPLDWVRLRRAFLRHEYGKGILMEREMEYVLAFMGFRWRSMDREARNALCKGHRLYNRSEFFSTVQSIFDDALRSGKDPKLYAREYLDMIDDDLKNKQKFMNSLMKKVKKFNICFLGEEKFEQIAVRRTIREIKSEKRILHRMRRIYRRFL